MQTQPESLPGSAAKPFAAGGFAVAAMAFLSMGRAAIDPEEGRSLDPDTIALAALSVSAAIACLAMCGALARPVGLRDALGLFRLRTSRLTLLLCAGGLVGLSILTRAALVASGSYAGSGLETLDAAIEPEGPTATLALVGAVALAPGIAEELLFRGVLLGSLAPRFGPAVAVLVSAVLFGVFHVDPVHVAGAIPLGLYLGAVRIVTGSTLAAIFCHIANNGFAIALISVPGPIAQSVGAAGLLCLAGSLFWLARGWPRSEPAPVATPQTGG